MPFVPVLILSSLYVKVSNVVSSLQSFPTRNCNLFLITVPLYWLRSFTTVQLTVMVVTRIRRIWAAAWPHVVIIYRRFGMSSGSRHLRRMHFSWSQMSPTRRHKMSVNLKHVTLRSSPEVPTSNRASMCKPEVSDNIGISSHYLYPFSVHVVTFNFITNLMHIFN